MRFNGQINTYYNIDYCRVGPTFPFDIYSVPVVVKAEDLQAKLRIPTHRMNASNHSKYKTTLDKDPVNAGDGQLLRDRVIKGEEWYPLGICVLTSRKFDLQREIDQNQNHVNGWSSGSSANVYEKEFIDPFVVHVIVARKFFSSYIKEIFIMHLMVLIAATSLYDVAELSGRLSTPVTILLTLVTFITVKPKPIEDLEVGTYHDDSEQRCLLWVVLVCLFNVVSTMMCGGEDDDAPAFLIELYQGSLDNCTLGWCGTRKIDCNFLLVCTVGFLTQSMFTLTWYCCDFLHRKHEINSMLEDRRKIERDSIRQGTRVFEHAPRSFHSLFSNLNGLQAQRELIAKFCRLWCYCNSKDPHYPCHPNQTTTSRPSIAPCAS